MLQNIEMYILIFFTYSFAGWMMESVGGIFNVKKFINRGFLIGPYCPVYGVGVVIVSVFLKNYSNDIPVLFILSILICGILEYFTGYIMEKLFNARWWDYSNKKFNINGRICLETLVPFGIAATIIICKINPFILQIYGKLSSNVIHVITGLLSIFFIIDFIISFRIILSFKGETYSKKDNTEEIGEMVKEKTEDVLMKAESDLRYFGRKLRIKTLRKSRYTRKRFSETIYKTPKELSELINEERQKIRKKVKQESEKFNNHIKIKKAEVEMKQKERKQILDTEVKKAKIEIEKIQKISKERIDTTITNIKTSSDEFTKQVVERFKNKSRLRTRLIEAFPRLQVKNKTKDNK